MAVAALAAIGALLATALLRGARRHHAAVPQRLAPWQLARVALAAARGDVGLWISVEVNTPPGAAIAVLGGAVFVLVAGAPRGARPPPRRPRAGAAPRSRCSSPAAASRRRARGRLSVVATTTQIGDFVRAVGGDAVEVVQILAAQHRPARLRAAARGRRETADAKVVLAERRRARRAGWATWSRTAAATPTVVDLGATCPCGCPGEASGPEASRYDPHWWHDPRNVEAAVGAIRDALDRGRAGAEGAYRAQRRCLPARLRRARRGHRAPASARVPAAQRKLVTDHDAFGYFARRYGIKVVGAVIPSQTTQAQPSAGDIARAERADPARARQGGLPRELDQPEARQAIARQTGATRDYELYGDTLGPAARRGATYLTMERGQRERDGARIHRRRARGCPIRGAP